jgi:DNA-directed RNA polymerase specialized sigma24 family protein
MNDQAGYPESLFDAHGEALFRYCWFLLRGRDASEAAVRDTLVVAAAHYGRLPDPTRLRPWLYALARTECGRRRPAPPGAADEPPARPSQPDADSRVLAWNAVTSMPPVAGEALELVTRHGMTAADMAFILGVPGGEAESLLAAAREELARSLGAYVVVRRTGFDCAGLTAALRGWTGTMTGQIRDRVLAHAADCAICGRHLPRQVSVSRVFGLLPAPRTGPAMRVMVLTRLADPRHAGYRDFVARRAAESAALAALAAGPETAVLAPPSAPPAPPERRRRAAGRLAAVSASLTFSRGRLIAGIAAAGVAAAAGAILVLAGLPGSSGHGTSVTGTASGSVLAPGKSERGPSRIGTAAAAPITQRGTGETSPPFLVAAVPGGHSAGRDGQALYLSAAPQSPPRSSGSSPPRARPHRVPPISVPPMMGVGPSPSTPAPSEPPPTWSPAPPPAGSDSGSPSSSPSGEPSIVWQRGGDHRPRPTPCPTPDSPAPSSSPSPAPSPGGYSPGTHGTGRSDRSWQ